MTIRKEILIIGLALIGLSAVSGGIGLITPESIGVPVSDLEGSIFASYLWPGLILAIIVGGTHLIAVWLMAVGHKYQMEAVAVAGFGLLIWMFTEVCIVGYHSWLQPLYFVFAVLTLISVMFNLKGENKHE